MSTEKMRVIALGGCGGMGQFAVRTALTFDFIEKIIIADLDEARAQEFAAQCGPKSGYARIDIEDSPALKQLFSETDVVMSTVGPYYRLGVSILKAAIESGCDYLDINDDWEPTLEMLDLSDEAQAFGAQSRGQINGRRFALSDGLKLGQRHRLLPRLQLFLFQGNDFIQKHFFIRSSD